MSNFNASVFSLVLVAFATLGSHTAHAQASAQRNNLSLQVDSPVPLEAYVEVSGPGIKTPLQYKFRAGRGKAGAGMYVPPGPDRTFTIFVRNDKGDASYLGTVKIAVQHSTPSIPLNFIPFRKPEKLTGMLGTYRLSIEQQPSPAKMGEPITYTVQVLDPAGKVVGFRKNEITWSGKSSPSFPKPKREDADDPLSVNWTTNFHGILQTCWQTGARSLPWVPVVTPQPFRRITSGDNFSCAVDTTGAAWCWGEDEGLQLGYPADYVSKWPDITGTMCYQVPCSLTPVPVSGGITFQSLTAGAAFVCGIDTTGKGWCWGDDSSGEFGVTALPVPPQPIGGAFSNTHKFLTLSAGELHACGVTTDHELFCWGRNVEGQLGIGSTNPVAGVTQVSVPGKQWAAVSAGTWHTCGLTTDSAIYCWGLDETDELGIDITKTRTDTCIVGQNSYHCMRVPTTSVPAGLPGGSGSWDMVGSGHNFSCGRDASSGNTYCWGESDFGQLGAGNLSTSGFDMSPTPLQVSANTRLGFLALPKAAWYACALPFNINGPGDAVCWGSPFFIGVPWGSSANTAWTPISIAGFTFLGMGPASDHICALDNNGVA